MLASSILKRPDIAIMARARALAASGGVILAVAAVAWWARRTFVVLDVVGASMEPGLHHAQQVIVVRQSARKLKEGDIVVFRVPGVASLSDRDRDHLAVKRIDHIDSHAGTFFVMGDNRSQSIDSRHFGVLRERDIVGKATRWRLSFAAGGRYFRPATAAEQDVAEMGAPDCTLTSAPER